MITLSHYLGLSAALFLIGVFGALTRRNIIGVLMGIELMFNAANINLAAFNHFMHPSGVAGQAVALFIVALRHLGAARTSALFATAPGMAILLSWALLGEIPGLWTAAGALLMIPGAWLLIRGEHSHRHVHAALRHEHRHVHDEHHCHEHLGDEGPEPHSHPHEHERLEHEHAHVADFHHRHSH